MPPRILIVDDHDGYRKAVRMMLEADGFQIVGEARGGVEALALIDKVDPDIVLLDIQLPDLDGFAVAARISETQRDVAVVLISSRDADAYGGRVEASPCRGFIAKPLLSGASIRALAD